MANKLLKNPYLGLYVFFNGKQGEEAAEKWGKKLAGHLGVSLHHPDDPAPDSSQHICSIYPQHDAWVIYASVDLKEAHSIDAWQQLSITMFAADGKVWGECNKEAFGDDKEKQANLFWGATLFFGAEVASVGILSWINRRLYAAFGPNSLFAHPLRLDAKVKTGLEQIRLLPESNPLKPIKSSQLSPIRLSQQPWGLLWQLAGPLGDMLESAHIYAALCLPEESRQAQKMLFKKKRIDLVELSLHKSYRQLQHYELAREQFHERIDHLDRALVKLLKDAPHKHDHLPEFSKEYVEFAQWVSQATELQHTVSINTNNYQKKATDLDLFRQKDKIFIGHLQQLQESQVQLQADKIYYQAAIERVDTGLQAVRADSEFHLAKRDKRRNLLLAQIGILLGLIQILPIAQDAIKSVQWEMIAPHEVELALWVLIGVMTLSLFWQLLMIRMGRE